ncbi:hypothetical protein N6H14_04865 [Paenibacillus sp. CC-CFT747]|nr:hypothetical protein N6H14_04865 [Paenibacillus sp. CC-CFT747]
MLELSFLLLTYFSYISIMVLLAWFAFFLASLFRRKWWQSLFLAAGIVFVVLDVTWLGLEYYSVACLLAILMISAGIIFTPKLKKIRDKAALAASLLLGSLMLSYLAVQIDRVSMHTVSSPNEAIHDEDIRKDLSALFKRDYLVNSIMINRYLGNFTIHNTNKEGYYLDIHLTDKKFDGPAYSSNDLINAMRIWQYIKERQPDKTFLGVRTSVSGWSSQFSQVMVTKDEFDDIYETSLNKDTLSLADLWTTRYRERYEKTKK